MTAIILKIVQTFEQGGGDKILEPWALFLRYITIIEEIAFGRFDQGTGDVLRIGRDPEKDIHALQRLQSGLRRLR